MKDKMKVLTLFVAVMIAWGGLFYALTNAASTVSADEGYPVWPPTSTATLGGYPAIPIPTLTPKPTATRNPLFADTPTPVVVYPTLGYPAPIQPTEVIGYPEPVASSPEVYGSDVQESVNQPFNLWQWIQSQFAKLLELMK